MCALLCICKCAIYKYISYFGGYYKQGYMRSIDLDLSEKRDNWKGDITSVIIYGFYEQFNKGIL